VLNLIPSLPFDVLNIILQYDGRIKYSHKYRIYVNIISKSDYRYNIVQPKINNQVDLINRFNIGNNGLQYYIDILYKDNEIGLLFSKKILMQA